MRIYQWHAIRIFRHNNRVMIPPVIPLKIITNNISRLKLSGRFYRFPLQPLCRSAPLPSHRVRDRPAEPPRALLRPPTSFSHTCPPPRPPPPPRASGSH